MARDAQLRVKPHLPQDKWLAVAARVEAVAEKLDRPAIIALLKDDTNDPAKQAQLAQTVKTFEADLDSALREGLTAIGFTRSDINAFNGMMNYSNAQNTAISDARTSTFNIEVELPGKLIGSNGKADETGKVKWQFNGEAFSDRDLELLATSIVPIH
jgi:hypothetical protein